MSSLVSVVIPFYSNIQWLAEAVKSVLQQTYKNVEIIVVNDGSIEDDSGFLSSYGDKVRYYKTENRGPAAARNKGIKMACGEYIAFLDSDDLWGPEKLVQQVKYMDANDLVWSHTGYNLFEDSTNKIIKEVEVRRFYGDVFINCLVSSPIATPCVMVKREFLMEHPQVRFAEHMRYGQDGFMWLSLAQHEKLGVLPLALSMVRMRGGNAALKARVYLKVKSQIWDYIQEEVRAGNEKFINLPLVISFAYRLCSWSNSLISLLENRFNLSIKFSEQISRLLYFPPYLMLKLYKLYLPQS
ncbi:glycosyltransferase family 2 protein [Lunatimonas salinarum]|uniref:glycosyltransferase family 2 protein n=1 Tax=Lunatimonas salinarum TaxID=1774590 RepID=UPI001AE0253C|nr:glycosyltransferase family 2 protein [Lunatimonas salinarum]